MMVYDLPGAFERSGDMPLLRERIYTIEDIYALPEGERAELIDGHIYYMAPPNTMHQRISSILSRKIGNYIDSNKGKCEVFAAPFAVYLDELDRLNAMPPVQHQDTGKVMLNVALPKGRLGDKVYNLLAGIGYGCPEDYNATRKLVVENPAGVREYWIVDPVKKLVMVYDFENEDTEQYTFQDSIKVGIYEELRIDFAEM